MSLDPIITMADGIPTVVGDPDVPFFYPGALWDPKTPNTDVLAVADGYSPGVDDLAYRNLDGESRGGDFQRQAIVPIQLAKMGTGWRSEVDLVDTPWPYRVVALTVYTDPVHPRISEVIVHPVYGYGDSNFDPRAGQTAPSAVDIESGLAPSLSIMGDEYGLIGPNAHA